MASEAAVLAGIPVREIAAEANLLSAVHRTRHPLAHRTTRMARADAPSTRWPCAMSWAAVQPHPRTPFKTVQPHATTRVLAPSLVRQRTCMGQTTPPPARSCVSVFGLSLPFPRPLSGSRWPRRSSRAPTLSAVSTTHVTRPRSPRERTGLLCSLLSLSLSLSLARSSLSLSPSLSLSLSLASLSPSPSSTSCRARPRRRGRCTAGRRPPRCWRRWSCRGGRRSQRWPRPSHARPAAHAHGAAGWVVR